MSRFSLLRRMAAVLTLLLAFAGASNAQTQLLMLDAVGCPYCDAWTEDIAEVYHKTEEGRIAPLIRQDIGAPLPDGIVLTSAAVFTPTFVLLVDGQEINRITGYPGEDFWWWFLNNMLDELPEQQTEVEGS